MSITTVNPATGERIAEYERHDAAAIETRVAAAARAATVWRGASVVQRADVVRRAGALLRERADRYARLMTVEMGKTLAGARAEVEKCAVCCDYYADHAERILAPEVIIDDVGDRAEVRLHPIGVVLAVMPWNFPFWQVIRFAAPALVAGNVGLLKHATNVPGCALALEELFRDAGAPDGAFTALLASSDVVEGLLDDTRIAAATLTGSEGAGSAVGAQAGRRIKKTVLELGGSDPFIVMPSADVERAATVAAQARTVNAGQSCIAAKRFIVHTAVYDRFLEHFVAAMRGLAVGDPLDEATDVGPMATVTLRDELQAQVDATVAAGARALLGGAPLPGPGNFYPPTVLVDVPDDTPAARDELFGPVAAVFRARDLDDAIRRANDSPFGLGASAWSRDEAEIERLTTELEAGSVFINAMVASDPRLPFGGVKRSGYGRELGPWGLREFVNIKTVRIMSPHEGDAAARSATE